MAARRWSIRIALIVVTSLLFCAFADRPATAATSDEFLAFWHAFRSAALQGDRQALSRMIALPFTVEDTTDEETQLDAVDAVLALMPALLEQDAGMSAEPESMRHYIERQTEATDAMLEPAGARARVGQFVFALVDGHWRLVTAYLER